MAEFLASYPGNIPRLICSGFIVNTAIIVVANIEIGKSIRLISGRKWRRDVPLVPRKCITRLVTETFEPYLQADGRGGR